MKLPFNLVGSATSEANCRARFLQRRYDQVVGRRMIELLALATELMSERRNSVDAIAHRRQGRCPVVPDDMALIQVALYLEGDVDGSSRSVFGRLKRLGYVDEVPHQNTVASWRTFDGAKHGSEIAGAAMLGTLGDLFRLTVEPAGDFVRDVVVDAFEFTTPAERKRRKAISPPTAGSVFFRYARCRETGLVAAFDTRRADVPLDTEDVQGLLALAIANGVPKDAALRDRLSLHGAARRLQDETVTHLGSKNVGQRLIEIYCKVIVHNLRRLIWLELERGWRLGVGMRRRGVELALVLEDAPAAGR